MDQKLQHFDVILGSVKKIQKELDDLKEWIHLQIYEVKGGQSTEERQQDEFDSSVSASDMHIEQIGEGVDVDEVVVKNEFFTTETEEDYILPDEDPFNQIGEMYGGGGGSFQFHQNQNNSVGHNYNYNTNTTPRGGVVRPISKRSNKSIPSCSTRVKPIPILCKPPDSDVEQRPNYPNQNVRFMRTFQGKKDSHMLYVNGYTFHRSAVRQSKTHWICCKSGIKYNKCRAAAATATDFPVAENEIPQILYIAPESEHTHGPTLPLT